MRPASAGPSRRRFGAAALSLCWPGFAVAEVSPAVSLAQALQRARALRDEASSAGDQPFGAVVWCGGRIVGEAPSRVVTAGDPTAHAEMEAIRDAARRLGRRDLSDCVLVSTSRPCRMCEAAAGWARIERLVHGDVPP